MIRFDNEAKAGNGFRFVFGVDEAGRGPLAGPVVAAAVLLTTTDFSAPVGDSKKLTPGQRERAFVEILERAWIGMGIMNERVIDEVNILRATHLAMALAMRDLLARLPAEMQAVRAERGIKGLVDGNSFSGFSEVPLDLVVGGDRQSASIACASIVAKVWRDRIMGQYDKVYPAYFFARHKGYPTSFHREAVLRHGPSPIHRASFRLT
ncbi:MAG: ribonuclease HII [Elusimicrobia bacterium]|nr:ribonuclease HII [Elusimicrobiota bacterium]